MNADTSKMVGSIFVSWIIINGIMYNILQMNGTPEVKLG